MAMNKPLFDIDRKDLQITLTHYKPGNGLAWATLFPLKSTRRFELKGLEGNEGIAVSAERVAFNTKAPLKTRETIGTWSGKLGKISVSRQKDEEDINDYNDLKAIAANADDQQAANDMLDMIYDDVEFCNNSMNIKNEIDCLRIASSGVMTFPEEIDGDNATADTINFNVPEDNFMGASKVWTVKGKAGAVEVNDEADPIGDIIRCTDAIAAKGYPRPRYAYMDKSAFLTLRSAKKTATRLYPNANNIVINNEMITLDSINSYMERNGYPVLRYTDSYARIEDKKGDKKVVKPWNENVVTLCPEVNLGYTYYKTVPMVKNTEAMQEQGAFYKLTCYSDLNPMLEVTMAEAYIQPVLVNRRSTVFLNINATTWNKGVRA